MPLSPVMQAALKTITALKPRVKDSLHQQRTIEDAVGALELGDPRVQVDRHVEKLRNGKTVLLLIFTPRNHEKLGYPDEDCAGTIFFIHGGGWVTGNVELYNDACKQVAHTLKRRIISIDYPLAPETKFPEALNQCFEVFQRLAKGEVVRDIHAERLGIFGDSAGGNLSAALTLKARDTHALMPAYQILLYPVLNNDYTENSPFASVQENGFDYLLTAEDCREYLRLYTKNKHDLKNPYLAPLLTASFKDLPKTLVISAEYCPLRDEDETYAEKLKAAKVPVLGYRVLDAIHGYMINPYMRELMKPTLAIMNHFLENDELVQEEKPTWLKTVDGINSTT